MKIGYFLSCEEWGPSDLVNHAVKAQEAGFHDFWISDHYHPWMDVQGHSPFVWAVIGTLAKAVPGAHVTTAVTCPTLRIHPAVIAQAAATSAVLLDGRFTLGVGTGEALNEHIFGDAWPEASDRRDMLEEAVDIIRALWGGGVQSHRGAHYRVEHARIYDLPETPPEIIVSGFGESAVDLAAKIGDGFCTVKPDGEAVTRFRSQARRGSRVQGGLKVCFGSDERQARETAFKFWANDGLPGELAQILPTPSHFEQACELVDAETATAAIPCGPDPQAHVEAIRAYERAGFDEVYIQQVGPEQEAFFAAYSEDVLPHFAGDGRLAQTSR